MTKYKGKDKGGITYSGANIIWEGHAINSQYLLRCDRIIQTDEDLALVQQMIDNAPVVDGKKLIRSQLSVLRKKVTCFTKTSIRTVLSTWMTAKS